MPDKPPAVGDIPPDSAACARPACTIPARISLTVMSTDNISIANGAPPIGNGHIPRTIIIIPFRIGVTPMATDIIPAPIGDISVAAVLLPILRGVHNFTARMAPFGIVVSPMVSGLSHITRGVCPMGIGMMHAAIGVVSEGVEMTPIVGRMPSVPAAARHLPLEMLRNPS